MAEGIITYVDGVAMLVTPDGNEYRWSDVQRYNNPGAQVDDRTGEIMALMPSADVAPTPPDERSLGSRVGNEDIAAGVRMMTDADASLYNLLDPSGRYSSTLLGRINRLAVSPLDVLLGGLTAGSGVAQKGMGYASDALGLGLRPGDIPTAEEQGQLADALYALPASRMLGAISEAGGRAAATRAVVDRLNQPGPVPTMGSNFGNFGGGDGGGLLGRKDIREYSAAARQSKALKQNKGSYEQMRAMLKKAGVTEEELQWTGADNVFKGKSVTKDELEQFFLDRTDAISEARMSGVSGVDLNDPYSMAEYYTRRNLDSEIAYYTDEVIPDALEGSGWRPNGAEWVSPKGTKYPSLEDAWQAESGQTIRDYTYDEMYDNAIQTARLDPEDFISSHLRLDPEARYNPAEHARYFPKNGENYSENLYLYQDPNVELLGEGLDPSSLRSQGHFDDTMSKYDEAALLGWTRTGDFQVSGPSDLGYNVRDKNTGDTFFVPFTDESQVNLVERNPDIFELQRTPTGAPASGRARYIGEGQSDAHQKLRGEGGIPRNYDQTLARQQYDALGADNPTTAVAGYWNAEDLNARANALSDLVIRRYNQVMRSQNPDWVDYRLPLHGEVETPEMARAYDAFYDWTAAHGYNRSNFPASSAYSPEAQRMLIDLIGEDGSTPFPDVNKALAEHRMANTEALTARKAELLAAGADPVKFTASLPYGGASSSKWNEFLLRRSLFDAIREEADWLATPYDIDAIADVGGGTLPTPGSVVSYRNIFSKDLQNLARKYDPSAKLEMIDLQGGRTGTMPSYGLRLTPEFIDKVARKGIPIWMLGGTGVLGSGLLGSYNQDQQPSAGLLGGM
jgi:hypothetical protein